MIKKERGVIIHVHPDFRKRLKGESGYLGKSMFEYSKELANVKRKSLFGNEDEDKDSKERRFPFRL